jgi:hypothetical protein
MYIFVRAAATIVINSVLQKTIAAVPFMTISCDIFIAGMPVLRSLRVHFTYPKLVKPYYYYYYYYYY